MMLLIAFLFALVAPGAFGADLPAGSPVPAAPTGKGETITLKERIVYFNKFGTLYDDEVRFPNGTDGRYLRFQWNKATAVAILPQLENGAFVVTEHYRYALKEWLLEIPRGMETEGSVLDIARKELADETGLQAGTLVPLGVVVPDSGILASKIYMFLAKNCRPLPKGQPLESDSGMIRKTRTMTRTELLSAISSGAITDSLTLSAFLLAQTSKEIR